MRQLFLLAAIFTVAAVLSGCGSGGGTSSRVATVSEPFRVLPPSVTFAYKGTATVNEAGANRTIAASGEIITGPPGVVDPRTNTPALLFTQTFSIEGVESLLYRDFYFSQPQGAVVAQGSEVLGVTTFSFTPEMLLPSVISVGDVFGDQSEPYETLTVRLRGSRVIAADRITVAGAIVDTFRVHTQREIPFSHGVSRFFDETNWYAPGVAGPIPLRQRIVYLTEGKAVTLELDVVGIPVLP